MGDGKTISAEEFATWMTAPSAVRLRSHLNFDDKVVQIVEWLRLGHLRSVARHTTAEGNSIGFRLIDKSIWDNSNARNQNSSLWSTGDVTAHIEIGYSSAAEEISLLDVRFDPAGLEEFIPQFALLRAVILRNEVSVIGIPNSVLALIHEIHPAPAEIIPESKIESGPPISEAALKEWYEVYRKVFTGAEDTEPKAIASAQGCFPGRSVARSRIRDLRGAQKRGPKSPTLGQ